MRARVALGWRGLDGVAERGRGTGRWSSPFHVLKNQPVWSAGQPSAEVESLLTSPHTGMRVTYLDGDVMVEKVRGS